MLTRTARAALIVSAAALALSACGSSSSSTDGGASSSAGLTGTVAVDGSSTVAPLTSVAAELYKEATPGVDVTVGTSGTGGGFEKFCRGEKDVNNASRPIKESEVEACKAKGIEYQEMIVAIDALTVVVNKENTWAKCLTVDQLKKMWEPDSKVNNWNQVDPTFPDEPLKLFGPGTDSGTFDYFTKEINGKEGASTTNFTPSEDDNVIVTGVSGTKGGLGYFGFSYYEENSSKLTAVEVDGGKGCVAPSAATAQDGTYVPLSRPLFVYPSIQALKTNTALKGFLDFYVAKDAEISEAAQFIPLNDTQRAELAAEYKKALTAAGL